MKLKKSFVLLITIIISLVFNTHIVLAKPNNSPPPAPSVLKLSNITTNSITLGWSSVSGASGYYVYMATPYDSNYSKITTTTGTTLVKSGLTANTQYWFYVSAYNRYGTSQASVHVTASTLQTTSTTTRKQVLGFSTYYYNGDTSSYNSMATNTSMIDEIATQTYTTDSLGSITALLPTNQITYATSNGIKTYAMLQNNFDGNIAKSVLENQTNRQALENNLLNSIKADGYIA